MAKKRDKVWQVVVENRGLVGAVIKKHFSWVFSYTSVLDYGDLYTIGLLGLHRAVELYDPKKGYTLGTYAFNWIRQYIHRAFQVEGFRTVRVPCYVHDRLSQVKREVETLIKEGDSQASALDWEGMSANEVAALHSMLAPISLSGYLGEDDDGPAFQDVVVGGNVRDDVYAIMESQEAFDMVEAACSRLDPRSREVLARRYGLWGLDRETLDDIAEDLELTRERVRQLEVAALARLRKLFPGREFLEKEGPQ